MLYHRNDLPGVEAFICEQLKQDKPTQTSGWITSSNILRVPHRKHVRSTKRRPPIKKGCTGLRQYLCAWGNDAASEVLTEARQLLVENYFQTPSWAWVLPRPKRISGRAPFG
ncbi:unnamed protein product, partial [Ilex paraguariensis]